MGISQQRVLSSGTDETAIWEIVDIRELPEVAARMRQGKFQSARSVSSKPTDIDAPLLVYQPHHVPQVLFIPARDTSAEDDVADRERLVGLLLQQLGEAGETPEELALAVVVHAFLPLFLAEDDDIRALAPMLQLLLQVSDGEQAMRVTGEHPDLLNETTLKALDFLRSAPLEGLDPASWEAFLDQHSEALKQLCGQMATIATPALFAAVERASETLSHYEASQLLDDLEQAVEYAHIVTEDPNLSAAALPFQAKALHVAARISLARFVRLGQPDDLATARRWLDEARKLVADDPAAEANFLDSLAVGLAKRYQQSGNSALLNKALDLARQAVDLTPEGHPDRPGRLNNLANMLSSRFGRVGEIGDLEAAIQAARQAVDLTPEKHPDRPMYLNNLANMLADRFGRVDEIGDLEVAIQAARQAVALTPEGQPYEPAILNNLATMLSDRFGRVGEIGDLEAAIQAARQAIDLTPEGHPDRPGRLNNLANMLASRFGRVGEIGDLEAAIQAARQAVDLTPEGHPNRPDRLNNLATMLSDRFGRVGEIGDLEAAIQAARQAVDLTPEGHPHKPAMLNNLSTMLSDRFGRVGEIGDL